MGKEVYVQHPPTSVKNKTHKKIANLPPKSHAELSPSLMNVSSLAAHGENTVSKERNDGLICPWSIYQFTVCLLAWAEEEDKEFLGLYLYLKALLLRKHCPPNLTNQSRTSPSGGEGQSSFVERTM